MTVTESRKCVSYAGTFPDAQIGWYGGQGFLLLKRGYISNVFSDETSLVSLIWRIWQHLVADIG